MEARGRSNEHRAGSGRECRSHETGTVSTTSITTLQTSAITRKEAPAADAPTLMDRQGLRARASQVFALSRWTWLESDQRRYW